MLQFPSPSFLLTGAYFWYKLISALFDKAWRGNLVVDLESKSRNTQARAVQDEEKPFDQPAWGDTHNSFVISLFTHNTPCQINLFLSFTTTTTFAQQFHPKSHQLPLLNCVSRSCPYPPSPHCHEGNHTVFLEKGTAVSSVFKSPRKI